MKVLHINGSPKRGGSDTMHLARAFLSGMAQGAEVEVETVHVIDRHIEYCRGCFACMKNGGRCVHDDDMAEILQKILAADVLVFSYPLYCYGMPAPLKALLDRTLPLSRMTMHKVDGRYEHEGQADYSHLRYVMLCGCGFPNSERNFEPAVAQFKLCFPNHHTIITVPETPMFNEPMAEVVTKPRLALVEAAGRQYAQSGAVEPALLERIGSPMIPEEEYARIANGEA